LHVQNTGDFNGDGVSDILWRNDNGDTVIWQMSGDHLKTAIDLGVVTNDWHILASGDYNGDGTSDILWRKRQRRCHSLADERRPPADRRRPRHRHQRLARPEPQFRSDLSDPAFKMIDRWRSFEGWS